MRLKENSGSMDFRHSFAVVPSGGGRPSSHLKRYDKMLADIPEAITPRGVETRTIYHLYVTSETGS
jgi:hypothetical protein